MINTVTTVCELRHAVKQARQQGKTVGFVPTMGALHAGHGSLIRQAAGDCSFIVVSIFVNPSQFRPSEDFTRYPRTLEQDQKLCHSAGAHLIFAPTVEEMYGRASFAAGEIATSTFVEVPGLSDVLEGQSRPGHFRGVSTVVAKLLNQVQPDKAYFGQKDAQQLAVIRQMARDLYMPIEIVGCPTRREEDGLAMSSRNRYLSPEERSHCTVIYHALCEAKERVQHGEQDAELLRVIMQGMLDDTPGCIRDYALVVNPANFQPLQQVEGEVLAVIAARFGNTRLIDNMLLTAEMSAS
ncbi:MAG TPA: pantoate--beta-alanine ligase [Gemmatales bacterium]|nr:pantoate--beta-alanine ligase [Gemmatales bacterium]